METASENFPKQLKVMACDVSPVAMFYLLLPVYALSIENSLWVSQQDFEIFFSQVYVLRIEIHTTNFQKVNIILPFPLCSELD